MKEVREFDLHGHTRFSRIPEGVNHSPQEVIDRASEVGLAGIAITGHDTLEGIEEALNYGARKDLIVIPGVEITSRDQWSTPHILALGINPDLISRRQTRMPTLQPIDRIIAWTHDLEGV